MRTKGKPCRPIGENLEESAAALQEQAEVIKLLGWVDQATTLEDIARTITVIAKMIRSGHAEVHAVAAFPQRNY